MKLVGKDEKKAKALRLYRNDIANDPATVPPPAGTTLGSAGRVVLYDMKAFPGSTIILSSEIKTVAVQGDPSECTVTILNAGQNPFQIACEFTNP